MNIRKLLRKDLSEYKRLKLESLKTEPTAFDSDYDDVSQWPNVKWENYSIVLLTRHRLYFFLQKRQIR